MLGVATADAVDAVEALEPAAPAAFKEATNAATPLADTATSTPDPALLLADVVLETGALLATTGVFGVEAADCWAPALVFDERLDATVLIVIRASQA